MSSIEHSEARAAQAQMTLKKVRSGIEEGQVPVISQIVRIVREISEKAESMSVQDLADIISQDPTTMQRIVSIAGTLGYNPGGAEITSILQAIALVGFERIRNLAISVMLLENVEQQCGEATKRELAGLSLSSGLVSAGLCGRGSGVEPDLAFLCGALRTYGRMLMATFMAEEYAKALSQALGGSSDEAYLEQFGLTPLELGRELLSGMQLPPMILKTLQEIPEASRNSMSNSPTGSLMLVADLGLKIADILATQRLEPEDFERQIATISEGFPESLHLSASEAGALVKDVATKISTFQHVGKYGSGQVILFERIQCLAEGRTPPPPFKPKPRKPNTSIPVPGAQGTPAADAAQKTHGALVDVAREEIELLLKAPLADVRRIFELVLQTMQNTFDLQSCLIFTRTAQDATFTLQHGVGPLQASVGPGLTLHAGRRDVFGLPLTRGEDVLIQDPADPRMRAFIPEWLRQPGACQPFMLLPLKDNQGPFCLICAHCRSPRSFAIASETHEPLRNLRATLSALGPILRGNPARGI